MHYKIRPLSLAIMLVFCRQSFAQHAEQETSVTTDEIVVSAKRSPALGSSRLSNSSLKAGQAASSDTAVLLQDFPGVAAYGAGGVSSLPVVHGLADDRLRIKVDGMDLIASCPNHMNSPLSYIDPTHIGTLTVFSGISPVSSGGDSIGATIIAETKAPKFAAPDEGTLSSGELGARYRSNGNSLGLNASATLATENLSVTYSASSVKAANYDAGGDFKTYTATGRTGHELARDEVGSTAYEARNHTLNVALRGGDHLLEAQLGYQDIPYELYPNQRMDMLGNEQKRASLHYLRRFDWGSVDARVYHEQVDHEMDFGDDKKLNYGILAGTYPVNGMPMYTESKTTGVSLKTEIDLSEKDLVRLGLDVQKYRLDDWWPPSPDCGVGNCIGGMAPLTFWNINGGERDRIGLFGEWESQWSNDWSSLIGIRTEQVTSNTGDVVGYHTSTTPLVGTLAGGPKYETSSVGSRADFNAMNRKRVDHNIDLTALGRYIPDDSHTVEFGIARKTRSPNLYERYAWSRNKMALEMNNFVGDGNGYLGNPDLEPEVAHTVSVTGDWHAADRSWEFKVTPYYTQVTDYIDAVRWNMTTNVAASPLVKNEFVTLMNQSARIYGLDVSGQIPLGHTGLGDWGLHGFVSYTNGRNEDTGDGLYNIMPLNVKAVLTQKQGGWDNALEVIGVKEKHNISDARNEIRTPGYSLVNLRSSYTWNRVRFDLGIENLFDRLYYLPLGGAYTGQGSTMSFNKEVGGASMWGAAVTGPGRSIYAGVSVKF